MKYLFVIVSVLCLVIFVSCSTKETNVNNYYISSPIEINWEKVVDPYQGAHGQLFITQKGTLFLISGLTNFKSNDAGKTWSKFEDDSLLYSTSYYEGRNNIIYNYNNSYFYTGDLSAITKSTDEGNTWTRVNPPVIDTNSKSNLQITSFIVAKNGDLFLNFVWTIDSIGSSFWGKGLVYRSTDDGKSWVITKNDNDTLNNIMNIKLASKNHIYAAQAYTMSDNYPLIRVLYSSDNGYNWNIIPNCQNFANYSDSSGILYQRISSGLSKSTDNGYIYTYLNFRFYGDFQDLAISKNGKLFCRTSYGLYESTNHGDDWTALIENVSGICDLAIAPDGYVYIRDSNYILYRSKQPIAN